MASRSIGFQFPFTDGKGHSLLTKTGDLVHPNRTGIKRESGWYSTSELDRDIAVFCAQQKTEAHDKIQRQLAEYSQIPTFKQWLRMWLRQQAQKIKPAS